VSDTLLALRRLKVDFKLDRRRVHAVRGVNLDLRAGEVLGVVGESGSGKTVTALSLMGLLPKTASVSTDSLMFEDKPLDPRRLRSVRGDRIAMVFQNPLSSFNPVQRVGVQIAEVLELHRGVSRAAALDEAAALLARVGIPESRKRLMSYPHEFSGGMLQRAMIAMAIACSPALLIADEPTTSLDVTVQAQVLELFASLRAEYGMALMMITHSLAVVANIADRVAVMYAGRVVEQGPVRDVLSAPAHPYTRALLQAVPKLGSPDAPRSIPGQPPDLSGEVAGCAYRARCELAGVECEVDPALETVGEAHDVACWNSEQLVAKPQTTNSQ
jgi:oligopeptide/dipeptide ABC transporter ATP-binding protein